MISAAEVVFFPVKPNTDPSELLSEATQIMSCQKDFRAAYYGPLVEDGKIHCLVLEWKDRAAIEAWTKVYDAQKAKELVEKIVNMEAGLEPFIRELMVEKDFTQFAHDITKAMTANVTGFRFFSLPDARATEAVVLKDIIGPTPNMNDHSGITVGEASGAAAGFVWVSKPEMADMGSTICFTETFGYDSVADHWKWRDTPEHAEVIKGIEALVRDMGLKAVDVLGKRRKRVSRALSPFDTHYGFLNGFGEGEPALFTGQCRAPCLHLLHYCLKYVGDLPDRVKKVYAGITINEKPELPKYQLPNDPISFFEATAVFIMQKALTQQDRSPWYGSQWNTKGCQSAIAHTEEALALLEPEADISMALVELEYFISTICPNLQKKRLVVSAVMDVNEMYQNCALKLTSAVSTLTSRAPILRA
ncbi:uncharacterized protein BDR25DRAFT_315966 [Lindgomyces ingoldianus]|uniref:Uncharacterized protein n=1 Tax=Lindgomyces ingoldianus TaxID=673940 RepID=A0ACB6QNE9_9PLEO|nr:uncharacterized protein BDR25DRAFT_315966 [Lindgomyces ingoldianus]KAF2468483.1 hypothetical protein BDR25DRAFT_315966 [Lindgomyces ingoldianus]